MKTNKYSRTYWAIVDRAKTRQLTGYCEVHHIIPRCMGGTDDSENLVSLTAREHFICHLLLIKMVDEEFYPKMVYAAWQLSRPSKYKSLKVTGRVYESLKDHLSKSRKGQKRKPFSDQARQNMREGAKNRKKVEITDERLESIREAAKKRKKLTGKANPFYGKKHSQEVSEKLSKKNVETFTGVPKTRVSCIYCRKEVTVNILPRFHGDHCKVKS